MTASVVINTCDRARCLERLLPSLNQLQGVRFEVVVVNGPSSDDTDAVLARYGDRLKVVTCPTTNLSQSRNLGIAAAAGDVVVFIDDDALPGSATWLLSLMHVFERDVAGRIGAAGGPALHRDTEWPEFAGGWTSDYAEQVFTDRSAFGPAGGEGSRPAPVDAGSSDAPGASERWCRRTVGNNSAFRRAALVQIGGFDERFHYYLDEADVCWRLAQLGYAIAHVGDAFVRHYPAMSPHGAPFIRNRRLIARSDTYFCLKNGRDPLPLRVWETIRRAPQKHFVRELPELVAGGRITSQEASRLTGEWRRGVLEGFALGLFGARETSLRSEPPPTFQPFQQMDVGGRLSVCLLSRRLPPDPHAGGVGRYTYDLARGLHELGHRVTIVAESDVPYRREALGFDIFGVRPGHVPGGLKQTPILAQNLAYAEAVADRVEALVAQGAAFDIVHASNWGGDALGVAQRRLAPLALMLVTPLECVIAAESWDVSLDLAANIELDQWLIEQATRVCAPSDGVLSSYRERARWQVLVHRAPLGIVCRVNDHDHDRGGDRPGGSPEAVGTAATGLSVRRLLFVGRLERRKGIHVLLDVLPRLLDRHPDWVCDVVGNSSVPAGPGVTFVSLFDAAHAKAPWRDRVRFHGAVSDEALHDFYRRADLFVAPSLFESFGLIYQEAMQYGVPVVGCAVGGVPDVVRHGEHGLLVTPGDAAALETALEALMTDEPRRRQMGEAAAADVQTHGTHLALATRMVEHYRAAMAAWVSEDGRPRAEDGQETSGRTATRASVAEAAIAVLEGASSTKGLGLAFRASAALEHGARTEAAELFAAALGVWEHPDYFVMALDLALGEGDGSRARELAARGFRATADDSEACVTFAAVLANAARAAALDPASSLEAGLPTPAISGDVAGGAVSSSTREDAAQAWREWMAARAPSLPERCLAAGISAIRASRDASAVAVLEACVFDQTTSTVVRAQALYHLGSALKRRGLSIRARACFERVQMEGLLDLLPVPLRAALHFHAGDLDHAAGHHAGAVAHVRACLALNADHGKARQLLDALAERSPMGRDDRSESSRRSGVPEVAA